MTTKKGIRVTVEDLETGEKESQEIDNDYIVVTAGDCDVTHTQDYPKSGTHILTIERPSQATR